MTGQPLNRHLVLIGYRGTGKSTVAQYLASALALPWVDADQELTRRAGRSISQIFADDGEPTFRRLESETLEALLCRKPSVIATGGGVILSAANRQRLAGAGTIVWLRATPESIIDRMQADSSTAEMRPALTARGGIEEIVQLLAVRSPLYAELAEQVIDTDDKTPAAIAAEILAKLGLSARDGALADTGESP
jgi:shikimate kinase